MPRVAFFICCDSTSVDYRTNVLSIFNVFEQVNVPQDASLKNVLLNFQLVTLWHRLEGEENGAFVQKIDAVAPSGAHIGSMETEFVLDKPRHRIVNRGENFPFRELGTYQFKLWVKRREEAEWGERPAATYYLPVYRKG